MHLYPHQNLNNVKSEEFLFSFIFKDDLYMQKNLTFTKSNSHVGIELHFFCDYLMLGHWILLVKHL
jgi:hypothetical protein